MRSIKIGLLWHNLGSANLGVTALSIANMELIKKAAGNNTSVEFIVLGHKPISYELYEKMNDVKFISFGLRNILKLDFEAFKYIRELDYVFDIGEGDSFSDVYGIARLINQVVTKVVAKSLCGCLVLAPQTYGPFKSAPAKILARFTSKFADEIYSRDIDSKEHYSAICKRNIDDFTDVAFALSFKNQYSSIKENDEINVGVNVSGLLYSDIEGVTKNFKNKLDFRAFIHSLIEYLRNKGANVYLISHVTGGLEAEDDFVASLSVKDKYPDVVVIDRTFDPRDIKSVISGFDFFVGGRMHATIGAFSSGVPVVPIAYSMKFKGVFGNLGYHHIVDAEKMDVDEAMEVIRESFENRNEIRQQRSKTLELANEKILRYVKEVKSILNVR